MKNATLYIESYDGAKTVSLKEEISIGRTDAANVVLGDSGLSRLNTTFFLDEGAVFVVDENSTNGTFVNNERVSGKPRQIFDGDRIKIGSETTIRVEINERKAAAEKKNQTVPTAATTAAPRPAAPPRKTHQRRSPKPNSRR